MEHIYKKLHANRYAHVELARRARDARDALEFMLEQKAEEVAELAIEIIKRLNEEKESTNAPLPETE